MGKTKNNYLSIEPMTNLLVTFRLAVHRKSWSAPICLSTITRPDFFQFNADDNSGFMAISRGEETD